MYKYILLIHILAATIWAGGHLVLATTILPVVLKNKNIDFLLNFEQRYERIGIPSLLLLVITGLILAHSILPDFSMWFYFDNHISIHIGTKLLLLLTTILLALHARFRLIPNLTESTLPLLAAHIIAVTVVSVLFVAVGISFTHSIF